MDTRKDRPAARAHFKKMLGEILNEYEEGVRVKASGIFSKPLSE
jgi:hypothetical protein